MEFGRIPANELDNINFTLPKGSSSILTGKGAGKLYIGCPKWGYTSWVGNLYPAGTKEKDFLSHYVTHFNCIELNATHYKIYFEGGIKKWADKAASSPDFRFCPKMVKDITHVGSLLGKDATLNEFLNSVRGFGELLGPIFIQVSERFEPRRAKELESFLASLPTDLTFFMELRHPGWFQSGADTFSILMHHNVGAIITDTAGRRDIVHCNLTIPKSFIRFVANDHPSDKLRLDQWIAKLEEWISEGIEEIYFIVHAEDDKLAPGLIEYVRKEMKQ